MAHPLLTRLHSWIFQFSVDVSLYAFTTFLPQIIRGLGFSSVYANLMTAPIYLWGLCTFLFTAWMSDRTGNRGYWIAGPLVCLVIGYAMLLRVDSLGVRYFACFGKFYFLDVRTCACADVQVQLRSWASSQRRA